MFARRSAQPEYTATSAGSDSGASRCQVSLDQEVGEVVGRDPNLVVAAADDACDRRASRCLVEARVAEPAANVCSPAPLRSLAARAAIRRRVDAAGQVRADGHVGHQSIAHGVGEPFCHEPHCVARAALEDFGSRGSRQYAADRTVPSGPIVSRWPGGTLRTPAIRVYGAGTERCAR